MVKPFKDLLQNQRANDLGLGMQHCGLEPDKVCSNDDLELTLTFFTVRLNFLPYALIWENIHFFRNESHLMEETYYK